jgi:hypothetical protein
MDDASTIRSQRLGEKLAPRMFRTQRVGDERYETHSSAGRARTGADAVDRLAVLFGPGQLRLDGLRKLGVRDVVVPLLRQLQPH